MFGYYPLIEEEQEEPDTLPAVLVAPEVKVEDRLIFCSKCGCNFINFCPSHKNE